MLLGMVALSSSSIVEADRREGEALTRPTPIPSNGWSREAATLYIMAEWMAGLGRSCRVTSVDYL
ncbi:MULTISPECIES: hypothetical protein [Halocynthiibacter]|uniref:Uncharacterized protein n=1 Tax=Halocynthiibacter halioticoli TaxID=2986804 RepID=A0AAE3LTU4_9RHOB|nr:MULTISPECIES: hypothetical protein [Halocynthiibacter]MCV6825776.1 hypothetical protein [Halocynthiibacter halioticoli]MCW4058777.1 hypothetical protein [Halocynthiibacter sp. SDUM655004]